MSNVKWTQNSYFNYSSPHYISFNTILYCSLMLLLVLSIFIISTTQFMFFKFERSNQTVNPKNIYTQFNIYLIGEGTEYETPYYVFKGNNDNPIVLIEAGIHGDELAGTFALDKLLYKINVHAGTLILFPRMNIIACNSNKRYVNKDLNHIFPGDPNADLHELQLANEIFEMIGKLKVEYLLTLHESKYLHNPLKSKTFGQTIIYGVKPKPSYLRKWLNLVNQLSVKNEEMFSSYYFPVENSSTEIMVSEYNLKGGFCIETWKGFDMERRIQLQTNVILAFLDTIEFKYSLIKFMESD